jgi:hypothetical protein
MSSSSFHLHRRNLMHTRSTTPVSHHPVRPAFVLAALVALCALLALPGAASAAKPTIYYVNDGPFEFDLCGIPTSLTIVGTERNHPDGVQNRDVTYTYTNLLTGTVLAGAFRATGQSIAVVDNPDGGQSFTYSYSGLILQLREGNSVFLVDAGRFVATDTFDADGNFLGEVILETPGPAHMDEARFCAAYVAATA